MQNYRGNRDKFTKSKDKETDIWQPSTRKLVDPTIHSTAAWKMIRENYDVVFYGGPTYKCNVC